jgi:hypothetical protein
MGHLVGIGGMRNTLKKIFIACSSQPRAYLLLDSNPLFRFTNQHHLIQFSINYLPYIRLPERPNHYIFTLKMATAMFAEMLDNFQHSMRHSPEI